MNGGLIQRSDTTARTLAVTQITTSHTIARTSRAKNDLLRATQALSGHSPHALHDDRIDRDIVAFANTRGGAILLGVCDDRTIKGETLTNDLKAKINDLARHCQPGISVQASQIGKVVVVEVSEGMEKPYSCGDGYFRRLNGTTQKMSPKELGFMFRENDPVPFEERKVKNFLGSVSTAKIYAFIKETGIKIPKMSA